MAGSTGKQEDISAQEMQMQALAMADYIAEGIMRQFPETSMNESRFPAFYLHY